MESYTDPDNTCLIDKCFSVGKSFKRVTDLKLRNSNDKIKLNNWIKSDL